MLVKPKPPPNNVIGPDTRSGDGDWTVVFARKTATITKKIKDSKTGKKKISKVLVALEHTPLTLTQTQTLTLTLTLAGHG